MYHLMLVDAHKSNSLHKPIHHLQLILDFVGDDRALMHVSSDEMSDERL